MMRRAAATLALLSIPLLAAAAAPTQEPAAERTRVDSYFDPFGNLTVAQRAAVETARELYRMGREDEAETIHDELIATLPPRKARQLRAYWTEHVNAVS